MRTWAATVVLGSSAVILASCAARRPMGADELTPTALTARIHDRDARITSLAGNGSVTFEAPEAGGSAYFTMNLRKPDSLLVQFEGPFGIGGGFLFACKEKYVMYDGLDNRVTTGVPTSRTIRGLIPIDLSLQQILDTFAGSFPLPAGSATAAADDDGMRLDFDSGLWRESYWIDPENGMVVRFRRTNPQGETLIDGKISRIREEDGVPFPHVISLSFPADGRSVTLYYNSVDLNAGALSFDYAIPPLSADDNPMNRASRVILLLAAALAASGGFRFLIAQDEITRKQGELESIRLQIKEYEDKIKQQQKNEKTTLELIDDYDRKGTLIRNLIGKLKGQEVEITRRIETTRQRIGELEHHLETLKKHYAEYVTAVYKGGRTRDLELLLSSESVNQFAIRSEYLKRFTEQRRRDAARIADQRREVENTQARLHIQLSEEQRLLAEKGAEEDRLATMSDERKEVLVRIRKDRGQVQREIERQLKAARELEGIIAQLIENDRIKKEREAEKARLANQVAPPVTPTTFDRKKGKLRWPVDAGRIVARFGAQKHPTLKTITQNTGIDISVKTGTAVTAVADGEVATLWWLPSFGNLLIINHYGGYRTVYTHLADITVSEGEHLKEGDTIGHSGESLDGPRLHFEIWKDREKQNPETWLAHQ